MNSNLTKHIKICTGKDNCSAGEYQVKQILNEMKIDYEFDSTNGLKGLKRLLRWDFIIKTDDKPLFIEYDGRQHFEPVKFGGISEDRAKQNFLQQKKHDDIKNRYCEDNGYLLLRIPYTEFNSISQLVTTFICENSNWGYE
jgi:hypothetical protein